MRIHMYYILTTTTTTSLFPFLDKDVIYDVIYGGRVIYGSAPEAMPVCRGSSPIDNVYLP